jgi:cytochrome c biogenesis protein
MAVQAGFWRRATQTIGAVRTGIIILIIVGIVSAAGTVILQRPLTSAEDMQRAYSPETLRYLDALGLTDVYHSWWYAVLLAALAISIIFASIERWPNAWRYYSRPYRRTDPSFRAVLPLQRSVPISDPAAALDAAELSLKKNGLRPERIVEHDEVSLYAEKSRYAVLAVYVVHASLLLIMLGGIFDSIWGYKGFVSLVPGQPPITQIELQNGTVHKLPFALRCDEAGQENYTGEYAMMPKRWWSKLTVLENGREVERKEIVVNDPLVREGIRFYQASYGQSSFMQSAQVTVMPAGQAGSPRVVTLNLQNSATLDDGSTVRITRFIPDAYQMDGGIYQRSRDLNAAAAEVEISKDGKAVKAWLFRSDQAGKGDVALIGPYTATGALMSEMPYKLMASLSMLPYTGLQVSHEPGQWAVWLGCILMGLGLALAFWVLHQRYWVVPVTNKEGQLVLWIGAAANKNREGFAVRFKELADQIETAVGQNQVACPPVHAASAVHS